MISHLFYHQETVEPECALNSWLSIREIFDQKDEVIILDLGNTLDIQLPFNTHPKYIRNEKIITSNPQQRSYTYGLNYAIPKAKNEWVILWRSDYIYSKAYLNSLKAKINNYHDVVVPYEAFIGSSKCNHKWCRDHLKQLMEGDEKLYLKNATVCPVYEMMDFPHFAIKKSLYNEIGGMNTDLYGYGAQFPELFYRIKSKSNIKITVEFEMTAFHQVHKGSFGMNNLNHDKKEEMLQAKRNMLKVFGNQKKIDEFLSDVKQKPLVPRRSPKAYIIKDTMYKYYFRLIKEKLNYLRNN